jgi:starch synthase
MKILFVSWELDPFFKFGGLGDVSRSLPEALKKMGTDIKNVIPCYDVLRLGRNKKKFLGELKVLYDNKNEIVKIYEVLHPASGVPVYLLRNKKYLSKVKKTDTFPFFDKAVVEMLKGKVTGWTPDIAHCNDNHAGLIPLLIKEEKLPIKTMFTIHNLSYQGVYQIDILKKLGIDFSKCRVVNWEIKGRKINFLTEGVIHADVVTTVSPTYAKEIMQEEYGAGLEEVLRGKEGMVFGILNGIDVSSDNLLHGEIPPYPYLGRVKSTDESLKSKLKNISWEEGKKLNKLYLQKKLGLKINASIPLLGFIGRFDAAQKGIDLIHKMVRRNEKLYFELIILGTGNLDWEERYKWLSTFYPKNVSCNFVFDEKLAKQIYAASDFMLIPSKFEPCGLIQMIAMHYGTLPIAYKTGGLKDSIRDGINGFLFDKPASESLERKVKFAINIWKNDRPLYRKMVDGALKTDFSWNKSAAEYIALYEKLLVNSQIAA